MTAPIGITCGDISGIGPELIRYMWLNRTSLKLPDFIVIGPCLTFADLNGFPLEEISSTAEIQTGHANAGSATAAADALRRAAIMALSGTISAVVTAPVHKASLYDIGFTFPGQTEFFADACGMASQDTAMMLAGPSLRTVPLTIHIPLRDVFSALTAGLIVRQATLVYRALQQDFGIASPRLALAGLKPHAGEGGHIGTEEQAVMQPAVDTLSRNGVIISGPLPADTLFSADKRNLYDAVLCSYHDQALIPVKTLDLDNTVNVTLGLPIVRTSPDHGTAHDIAGKGIAKPDSMIAALRLAAQIVSHRNMHG